MKVRILALFPAVTAAALLAGCGGGGGTLGGSLPGGGGGNTQDSRSATEQSIGVANSLGSPIKNLKDFNETMSSPSQQSVRVHFSATGQCNNGVEFFAPDKQGQPNSTERIEFYDSACTQTAVDVVRLYAATGSNSENVQQTLTKYAPNSNSPEAVRSENVSYSNASFDQYGFPIASAGFDRAETGYLTIAGSRTIDADSEMVLGAASNNTGAFCSDSAGFNATGNQLLGETFGWAGGASQGSRTVNNDGSVTWSATHAGTAYTGPIGSLSVTVGNQNTSCPIAAPMFGLAGGTSRGNYTLPIATTFKNGLLTNLTITNAVLANGDTLNVQTNTNTPPANQGFISGAVGSSNGTQLATFALNEFGDGTLNVIASGNTYTIVDWHVVK